MSKQKQRQSAPRGRKSRQQNSKLSGVLGSPITLVLGGIVLIAAALFALWRAQRPALEEVPVEVSGAPSLQVDRQQVDLGDVKVEELVSVSFQVANTGDQPLRFTGEPYVEVVEGC